MLKPKKADNKISPAMQEFMNFEIKRMVEVEKEKIEKDYDRKFIVEVERKVKSELPKRLLKERIRIILEDYVDDEALEGVIDELSVLLTIYA